MEQMSTDDFDCFFLQIKRQLESKSDSLLASEEVDLGLNFFIEIPEGFAPGTKEKAAEIFWSDRRPSVLLMTESGNEGITFQKLEDEPVRELEEYVKRIKQMIERTDDRTVFYRTGEEGEEVKVYWLEYKSFASNEIIYNMVFLFQTDEDTILGSFYCLFKDYDTWKPIVLRMLNTIKTEGSTDEGI